jgi:protein N-terminal methyltransferase
VNDVDVRDSNQFLDHLYNTRPNLGRQRAADCGAGIGRVSKYLLLPRFDHVDLIEQSPRLLAASTEYIGEPDTFRTSCIVQGLQTFTPSSSYYDVIWIQWVIGHLTDADFISFFERCALGLKPGGVIILKDNCAIR